MTLGLSISLGLFLSVVTNVTIEDCRLSIPSTRLTKSPVTPHLHQNITSLVFIRNVVTDITYCSEIVD